MGVSADAHDPSGPAGHLPTRRVGRKILALAELTRLPHIHHRMETFDYVIVGAGSAGSVLASRLSEDENVTVCVLEAGPWDWHPFIHIPAGFMYTLVNPKVNWLYKSEPSEWTGGRAIAAPRGKTLGGSSSINGHIYNRGQRLDFDGWAQRGNRGWGYADVLPYFRQSERRIGGRGAVPRPRRQPAHHRPRLARSALRGLH